MLSFLYSPTLTSIPDHWKNQTGVFTFSAKPSQTLTAYIALYAKPTPSLQGLPHAGLPDPSSHFACWSLTLTALACFLGPEVPGPVLPLRFQICAFFCVQMDSPQHFTEIWPGCQGFRESIRLGLFISDTSSETQSCLQQDFGNRSLEIPYLEVRKEQANPQWDGPWSLYRTYRKLKAGWPFRVVLNRGNKTGSLATSCPLRGALWTKTSNQCYAKRYY